MIGVGIAISPTIGGALAGEGGGSGTPANAITTDAGDPITTDAGDYIVQD